MKQKFTKYLIALALFTLMPIVGQAQTAGMTYTDTGAGSPSDLAGNHLTFTVTETTNGLQQFVDAVQNPLNGVIGNVVNALDGIPLLNTLGLPVILAYLTGIGQQTLNIDLGTIYTATINGPNGVALTGPDGSFTPTAWAGPMTIPATVYSNEFNQDNLLRLALNDGGLDLGILSNLLSLGLSEDINIGILKYLLNINLVGTSGTPGIPVVAIGTDAFYQNPAITSVDFSNATNLQIIKNEAFRGAVEVTSLNFVGATSLETIEENAFMGCNAMTGGLVMPSALKTIGSHAFAEIPVTSLNLDGAISLETIADYAFYNCTEMTGNLVMPSTLKSIGFDAFSMNDALTGLDLSGATSLETIGYAAFYSCDKLAGKLVMPSTLTSIGYNAFYHNPALTGLDLSGATSLQTIGHNAFYQCFGLTGSLVIPSTVTTIDYSAFEDDRNLESLDLSGATSLQTIGNSAFRDCSGLESKLIFPTEDKLTSIGASAFEGCSGITGDPVLPYRVTFIGASAFSGCAKLRSVTVTSWLMEDRDNFPVTMESAVFEGCQNLEYIDLYNIPFDAAMKQPASYARNEPTNNPFYGTPAHTVVYLPNDNITDDTYAAATLANTAADDNVNFVLGKTCAWLYVQDGCDYFLPYGFTAAKATYNMGGTGFEAGLETTPNNSFTFNKGTSYSLYLPYPFQVGTGMGGYALDRYKAHDATDPKDNTFVFWKQSSFNANTPYIARIEATSSATTATLPDATGTIEVPATTVGVDHDGVNTVNTATANTPSAKDSNGIIWTLCGTSEAVDGVTAAGWGAYYFATDGVWYPKTTALKQHRAFMVPSVAGSVPAKGLFGGFVDEGGNPLGDTAGIGGLTTNPITTTHIYNVSGQYVGDDFNALPKGVYIVNGKKIIK